MDYSSLVSNCFKSERNGLFMCGVCACVRSPENVLDWEEFTLLA